jgi:Domain of unknown function (DUF4145)
MPDEWRCPYCGGFQVLSDSNCSVANRTLNVGETKYGDLALETDAIRCANPDCNEITLVAELHTGHHAQYGWVRDGGTLETWNLLPASSAKPLPDYIPAALRNDYEEACAVRDLSPKASATLSRRCLQGMIRNFTQISKARLIDEIKELRKLVDAGTAPKGVESETVDAMDHVREIGNIGAHMEKDIDVIVDVDPGEAQALIDLIEMLFDEWYVAQHKREAKLRKIQSIAVEKKEAKAVGIKAS